MKNFGLKPTPEDPRDFSHKKTFGASVVSLPDNYLVGIAPILNQLSSWFCTAFASSCLSYLEDDIEFNPAWFFAQEKTISKSTLSDGEDLRTPNKTAVKIGSLPLKSDQDTVLTKDPMFLADSKNWPFGDGLLAAPYKKKSYFRVDGNFQEVKQVLYQNKDCKRAILTGVNWYEEWSYAAGGIVPKVYSRLAGGHCIPIVGFTNKFMDGTPFEDGEERIIIQNSWGDKVGDQGYFYFDEETFNKEFTMPMYMWIDLDPLSQNVEIKPVGNFLQILIKNILTFFGL